MTDQMEAPSDAGTWVGGPLTAAVPFAERATQYLGGAPPAGVQVPSVGRIVHYQSYGTPRGEYTSQCRAAIVTEVANQDIEPGWIGLCAINPTGLFFHSLADGGCHYDDEAPYRGGTWHWPERV